MGLYNIPSTIDGKPVVKIEDDAFEGDDSLTVVIIPETVTFIDTNAFMDCKNLSEIYICSSDISFGYHPFSSIYNRNCELTIYGPNTRAVRQAAMMADAKFVEWYRPTS